MSPTSGSRSLLLPTLIWCVMGSMSALGQSTSADEPPGVDVHGAKASAAEGRPADDASAEFVAAAREATARFHDLDVAIAAGYRIVGPDFPGMGEHWVNIRIAMERTIDPTRPAVLSYLRIDGRPVLTGVAYAAPLLEGEAPPDLPFPVTWHSHDGSIADETLHLNPHSMPMAASQGGASRDAGPRLAMIHAWIWADNPAGLFVQQNWELSRMRLGLDADRAVGPDAGKALFLLTGGVDYFQTVMERAAELSADEKAGVGALLATYRDRVAALAAAHGNTLAARTLDEMDHIWRELWAELAEVAPDAIEALSGGH